jgi:type I restriction enzyme M protein
MIDKDKHLSVIREAMNTLGGHRSRREIFPLVLSIYGLKVFADSHQLCEELGLKLKARDLWENLKRPSDHPSQVLGDALGQLEDEELFEILIDETGQAQLIPEHPLYLLGFQRDYFQEDYLSRVILKFDRLDAHAKSLQELQAVGEVVEEAIATFAAAEGKAGESYFTPKELNLLAAQTLLASDDQEVTEIYDPVCGVGGSLVALHSILLNRNGKARAFRYSGQDISVSALSICTWNLLLHGIVNFSLAVGDTLSNPQFREDNEQRIKRFDLVVANPPFNLVTRGDLGFRDPYRRFRYGEVTGRRADYAFIQHILASLKPKGRAAVFVALGTLFRAGFEQTIRENLVHADVIRATIALPANLFPSTAISTALIVFDLDKDERWRDKILFIDATGEEGPRGRDFALTRQLVGRITSAYLQPSHERGFAQLVSVKDVADQDYSLLPTRYVPRPEKKLPRIEELDEEIARIEKELNAARTQFDQALKELEV